MRLLFPAFIALTLATTPAAARPFSAVCTNLAGMRVSENGSEPAFTRDGMAGAVWAYAWDDETKKATLTLPGFRSSDGQRHTQKGVVSFHRGGFFTIVSELPGAVWTHAIYVDSGRLLVTQSTTKNSADLSGRMLVGTCQMSQ